MRSSYLALAASIVLIGNVGIAAAADHSAMSKQSSMSSTASTTKDNLSLTTNQEKVAWRDLSTQSAQSAPSNFSVSRGATLPEDIALRPIPANVVSEIPKLKPYQYARLPNEILIVDPNGKKIVEVINRHG